MDDIGQHHIHLIGGDTAINHVTLSRAGLEADVSIFGQNTTSDPRLGVGQLALIRHDVFASNVQLTVDNDESKLASILTLDGTSSGTFEWPCAATDARRRSRKPVAGRANCNRV